MSNDLCQNIGVTGLQYFGCELLSGCPLTPNLLYDLSKNTGSTFYKYIKEIPYSKFKSNIINTSLRTVLFQYLSLVLLLIILVIMIMVFISRLHPNINVIPITIVMIFIILILPLIFYFISFIDIKNSSNDVLTLLENDIKTIINDPNFTKDLENNIIDSYKNQTFTDSNTCSCVSAKLVDPTYDCTKIK